MTAVLNSVYGHQNVGEPIRFEVCSNCILYSYCRELLVIAMVMEDVQRTIK